MYKTYSLLSTSLLLSLSYVTAEELAPLLIEERLIINPNLANPDPYNHDSANHADGGDFLEQINGISSSRFGGRGLEPVIRGQSQTRINILLDGAYLHGGCPNRMDPPASWAALETYEEVKVLKGVQSVIYGGGGSGGTVLFERDSRGLAEEEGTHGRLSFNASSNGTKADLLADGMIADERGYLRFISEVKSVDSYTDGDGRLVRSAFEHQQVGIIAGLTPNADQLLEFSAEYNDFADALYPGASMDSPSESGHIMRVRFEDKPDLAWLSGLKFEAYLSDVSHLMDNYSLRPAPYYAANLPKAGQEMLRATPTTSKTIGGRLQLNSQLNGNMWTYGLDIQNNNRDASINNMDNGTASALSFMWPDVSIKQTGLFAEALRDLSAQQRLKYGIRIDFVRANANKAQAKPVAGTKTAQQVYNAYYGESEIKQNETNLGGLLRYEYDFKSGFQFAIGASRSVRTADASERYINKWSMPTNTRWVGNPEIKPEKHHQLDLSVSQTQAGFSWNTVFFIDKVSDYILLDDARGQTGVLLNDDARIYRNVDATLYGVEWEGRKKLNKNWSIRASFAYVHANNDSDDRAIAQTPPLNGKLSLDYQQSLWGIGLRLSFAQAQNRLDTQSRQEVGETAAYGLLDMYANYQINDMLSLRMGIDNLLDKTYAHHISRANLMDSETFKVNEAGRNAWLKLNLEF